MRYVSRHFKIKCVIGNEALVEIFDPHVLHDLGGNSLSTIKKRSLNLENFDLYAVRLSI